MSFIIFQVALMISNILVYLYIIYAYINSFHYLTKPSNFFFKLRYVKKGAVSKLITIVEEDSNFSFLN